MAGAATAHQRLTQLIKDYGSVNTIHPAVTTLRRSPANDLIFQQAFSNHYKLLLNRSSKLENFELNIFEAAFVRLMEDTKTHAGAIQLYVEELLGLKTFTQPLKLRALMGAVKVRTMFMNPAINDDRPQLSPTCNNPPFILPQTESGRQLLNNVAFRTGYTPIQLPLMQPSHGSRHPLASNPCAMNILQSRSTFNHNRQQTFPVSGKENRTQPALCKDTHSTSTVEMDDPKLAGLLSEYRIARHSFRKATADSAGYFILADALQESAQQCIQCMSKVKPDDARLLELCETLDEASGVVEKSMTG